LVGTDDVDDKADSDGLTIGCGVDSTSAEAAFSSRGAGVATLLSGLTRNETRASDGGFDTDVVPILLKEDSDGELLLALPAAPRVTGNESREYPIRACSVEVRRPALYFSRAERCFLVAFFSAIFLWIATRPILLGENRNEAFCMASLVRAG
jgi:hypothetical protein